MPLGHFTDAPRGADLVLDVTTRYLQRTDQKTRGSQQCGKYHVPRGIDVADVHSHLPTSSLATVLSDALREATVGPDYVRGAMPPTASILGRPQPYEGVCVL